MPRKTQEVRCPLCRLPFENPFEYEKMEPSVPINRELMTDMMNKYGCCDPKYLDIKTGMCVAPMLQKNETYAKHPATSVCVQTFCRAEGPHQCRKHELFNPFCHGALTPNGCQCYSKTYAQRMKLREVMENDRKQKERAANEQYKAAVKRQKVADEPPAEPALPAPK